MSWFKVTDEDLRWWCRDCGEMFEEYDPRRIGCYICKSYDFHKQSQLSYWMSRIIPGHAWLNNQINITWYRVVIPLKDFVIRIAGNILAGFTNGHAKLFLKTLFNRK